METTNKRKGDNPNTNRCACHMERVVAQKREHAASVWSPDDIVPDYDLLRLLQEARMNGTSRIVVMGCSGSTEAVFFL